MGNGLRCCKTAGDDILLHASLNNRRFTAFICIFIAALTGISVVDIFPNNGLGMDDLQSPDHFFADFGYSVSAFRVNEVLTLQTAFHLLNRNTVQSIFAFLPLVSCYNNSNIFFIFFL